MLKGYYAHLSRRLTMYPLPVVVVVVVFENFSHFCLLLQNNDVARGPKFLHIKDPITIKKKKINFYS